MVQINFCKVADEFGEFSNYAPFPIEVEGTVWPTSEHYFQAQKFHDPNYREKIRTTESPIRAASLGRDRRARLREDWEAVKVDIMRDALRAKFRQHADLRELLLSTGDARIVEHTIYDGYWGDGGDGRGRNWLGRLLMEVREEIRAELPTRAGTTSKGRAGASSR